MLLLQSKGKMSQRYDVLGSHEFFLSLTKDGGDDNQFVRSAIL